MAFGSARYNIVYADGFCTGAEFTLAEIICLLEDWRAAPEPAPVVYLHGPVARIEPIAGTQWRSAHGGRTFWWRDDLDMLIHYASCGQYDGVRLTKLALRSPVLP